jgi:hypothetical protein
MNKKSLEFHVKSDDYFGTLEGTHFIRHYSCKIPDKAGCK